MSKYRMLILVVLSLCLCITTSVYATNTAPPATEPPALLPAVSSAANDAPSLDPRIGHFVRWMKKDGGNNHWYAIIQDAMYWEDAAALAQSSKYHGKYGYLATITSAEENDFILNHVIADTHQPSVMDMFWLGGQDVGGRWTWTTGEPFAYANWALFEPNNPGIETILGFWGQNTTDVRRTPGTWNNSLPNGDINPLAKVWGIIEWGRLDENGGSGTTSFMISEASGGLTPDQYALEQNHPNPFNPDTEIRYTLAAGGHVRIDVINMLGQTVRTLVNSDQPAGQHAVTWYGTNNSGRHVSSGMYFYRLTTPGFAATKKMLLLR